VDERLAVALTVVAFLLPSAILSALLPPPQRLTALGLVALLALLLALAALWSARRARRNDRDAHGWAFLTVVTLGFAMLPLALAGPRDDGSTFVCTECGHRSEARAPFCYRCGAA
jgi:peptidoglycan/LPS O-acetylase OafA/YrhL